MVEMTIVLAHECARDLVKWPVSGLAPRENEELFPL